MTHETAQAILRLNRETYEKIAPEFDKSRNVLWDDFSIFDAYVKEGMRVLDIGCGSARLFRYLRDKGVRYIGIDNNQYLIEKARERYPRGTFIHGDVLQLEKIPELSGQTFDCVFCISLLSHIPSHEYRRYALLGMRTFVRPTGTLMMLNWNLWRPGIRPGWRQKNIWTGNLQRLFLETDVWTLRYRVPERKLGLRDVMAWWGDSYYGWPLYYRAFTAGELKKLCVRVGFRDVTSFYVRRGRHALWWNGRTIATMAHMTPIPLQNKAAVQEKIVVSAVSPA
ncbi:class I SAM-dependent methyltransferase [Candidatus Uhrbacteria bacterium]|nr:class I SAM-dependent methyltransferase [Candidatus Uhrbacteria bacterium]